MQDLKTLRQNHHQPGKLTWIGLRSEKRGTVITPDQAELDSVIGLVGDHWAGKRSTKRQITLIQAEHFPVIAALSGNDEVFAEQLRRNLVVEKINLYTLRDQRFRIGNTLFEGTGTCPPCSRMEQILGLGGYNAMRGHGGITARVIDPGTIQLGDPVRLDLVRQ